MMPKEPWPGGYGQYIESSSEARGMNERNKSYRKVFLEAREVTRVIPIFSSTSYFSVSAIFAAVSLLRVSIVVFLYSIRQSRSPFVRWLSCYLRFVEASSFVVFQEWFTQMDWIRRKYLVARQRPCRGTI